MTTKRRGLGRGLSELLGPGVQPGVSAADAPGAQLKELPVELLQPGKYQPRVDMHPDTLQDLADSIRSQGVVQPIVVRPIAHSGEGARYEIIAGERRWRAAQMAGLREIPTVVRKVADQAAIAMALIENIQRENLNPLEEANALQRLITEFKLTHEQAAEAVGRSRTAVTNLLRLRELGNEVKKLVESGVLEMGHARALLALRGGRQLEAARKIAARGLSVRETEQLVRRLQQEDAGGGKPAVARRMDPDIRRFQDELSERLGAKVAIQHTAKGKGRLVISYNSLDELDGILTRIK